MILITNRTELRDVRFEDIEDIHILHSLAETDQFNTLGIPETIDVTNSLVSKWLDAQRELPRGKYVFSIRNGSNAFIGLLGLNIGKPGYQSGEIWYKIHPQHWNNGYATEVVKALLEFCFKTLQLHRIEAGCATENIASIKVLEKSGFTKEGRRRKLLPIRGEWFDSFEYSILEDEY